ncbi:MAG: 3-keto-5-aminohexanoate cleavage protein, partial [Woeseia sp.]
MNRKVIITCAVTGSIHTPTMSPYLPVTPDDIATASIDAAKAGAAIIHLHARVPETGYPSAATEHFMQFLPRIKQECDAVLNISTGGSSIMSIDER